MSNLHAYIDESGDDGFSANSTEWLICSAFIIDESERDSVRTGIFSGAQKIWSGGTLPQDISFKNTSHDKRKALLGLITKYDFHIVSVLANKRAFPAASQAGLQCPKMYNYICKHLIERITWYADDKGKDVMLTFSKRKQINFSTLKHYILNTLRLQPKGSHDIKYPRLKSMNEAPAFTNMLLQVSDWIASSIGAGVNVNVHGDVELGYVEKLWGKFWIRRNNLWSYGMKCLPTQLIRNNHRLFRKVDAWLEDPNTLV